MTIKLTTVINRFKDRVWRSNDNKNLLNIVSRERLNIEPANIYTLDQLGLNHLEILNLNCCVGKKFTNMSPSDIDQLNYLENKYKMLFNQIEKQRFIDKEVKTHPMQTKLNSFVAYPSGNSWLLSSCLLQLQDYYFK